ncbi:hypothetical protein J6590_042879 [Homalodisca vitripennis]|nr:hypothetical protein J6590_042879 [Homalodisca vitripennis]
MLLRYNYKSLNHLPYWIHKDLIVETIKSHYRTFETSIDQYFSSRCITAHEILQKDYITFVYTDAAIVGPKHIMMSAIPPFFFFYGAAYCHALKPQETFAHPGSTS